MGMGRGRRGARESEAGAVHGGQSAQTGYIPPAGDIERCDLAVAAARLFVRLASNDG